MCARPRAPFVHRIVRVRCPHRRSYESRPGNSEVNTWTPSQAMELFKATNVFVGTVINATGDSYMYHEPAYAARLSPGRSLRGPPNLLTGRVCAAMQ